MTNTLSIAPQASSRETLVCLHSSGSSGRQWAPIAAALAPRFEVATPELLGYTGATGWPVGKEVSLDDEVAALTPWIHADGVHLFGHSYGATVALQIALRWPGRVKSLTLYEPVRFALLFEHPATAAAGTAIVVVGRQIGHEALSGELPAAAQRFVDYWSGEGTWDRLPPPRQQLLASRMPKVQAEFEALFSDRVPAAAYRALDVPMQLLGGSCSPLPARQVLDLLARQCPHATRTTLVGVGHMGPVEAPQKVLDALHSPLRMAPIASAA
jgi:pimeloyl-ACP methyl ester carboxylesterase